MLTPDPKGYYAVLEVQPNASPALIRAAWRVRAMELHPDRNGSLSSTPDFQRLQEAFDVLGDPARKAAYDAWAVRTLAGGATPRMPQGPAADRAGNRFAVPAGLAALVVAGVALWFYTGDQTAMPGPRNAGSTPTARPVGVPDALHLLAQTQALPTSGILRLDLPSDAFAHPDALPRLKLSAPHDAHYLVKLSTWDGNAPVMSVFVRAGDTTEVLVPVGRYRIRLASGQAWYGETLRFGPMTQYAQVDTVSEFEPLGDRLPRYELALERYAGTNAASTPIAATSF